MKSIFKGCFLLAMFACGLSMVSLSVLAFLHNRAVMAQVAGDDEITLDIDGRERRFWLHVPDNVSEQPALMIVLHGGGGHGANAARMSGMSAVADEHGFLVAYPNGTGHLQNRLLTWNSGNCCGYAHNNQVDDTAFISELIDYVIEHYQADPQRVYVTGMSNGGMMSHKIGCALSDQVAGIAPVAGALNVENCSPDQPVSVVIFHDLDDRHVLYEGGRPEVQADPNPRIDNSVAYAVDFWTSHNACGTSTETMLTDNLELDQYRDCAAPVWVYTIDGGGHSWPGSRGWLLGDTPVDNLNASAAMWAFFSENGQ